MSIKSIAMTRTAQAFANNATTRPGRVVWDGNTYVEYSFDNSFVKIHAVSTGTFERETIWMDTKMSKLKQGHQALIMAAVAALGRSMFKLGNSGNLYVLEELTAAGTPVVENNTTVNVQVNNVVVEQRRHLTNQKYAISGYRVERHEVQQPSGAELAGRVLGSLAGAWLGRR